MPVDRFVHKFPLSDVRWPGIPKQATLFQRSKAPASLLKLDLPEAPRRVTRGLINIIEPWKIWKEEEV